MTTHRIATLWDTFLYTDRVAARIEKAKKAKKRHPYGKQINASAPGWKSFKKRARNTEILAIVKCQMRAS